MPEIPDATLVTPASAVPVAPAPAAAAGRPPRPAAVASGRQAAGAFTASSLIPAHANFSQFAVTSFQRHGESLMRKDAP